MTTRRDFLKVMGLGAGASLLSPFIRQVHSQNMGNAPRRFVIVVEGNCSEPTTFATSAARAAIEAESSRPIDGQRWFARIYSHDSPLVIDNDDFSTASALSALSERDPALVDQSLAILGLSSKVTGGGHTTHCGALSCARSQADKPGGQTIDAYLANLEQVRRQTPFDALRLGITARESTRLIYWTCAHGPGKPASIITNASTAFNYVFGSVASDAGQKAFRERSQLLDYARTDVNRAIAEFPGNSRERAKLEKYLESLEEVTQRQITLTENEEVLRTVKPENPDTNPLYQTGDPLDTLRAQFQIATASLLGGLTNVVVLASGTGSGFDIQYTSLGASVGRHDLHHQSGGVASYRDIIHQVTRAHVGMIAEMAATLAATPEAGADGSMLDHTAILFMNDAGEQHHSTAEEWPMLLVGGSALGLRTGGRSIVYPGNGNDNNRQVSNVFNTLGFAAGEELLEFGAEGASRIAEGPLGEIYS